MRCKICKEYGFPTVQHGFTRGREPKVIHEQYRCENCKRTGWLIQEAYGTPRYTGILEGDKR